MRRFFSPFFWRGIGCRRDGAIAASAALLLVPLVLTAGVAIDLGRIGLAWRTAQNAVDSAALAGAATFFDDTDAVLAQTVAATYFAQSAAAQSGALVTFGAPTIAATPGDATKCSQGDTTQKNTVQVSTQMTVALTFMHVVTPTVSYTVSATAVNPLTMLSIELTQFDFDGLAADGTAAYWYEVPSDGSDPSPSILNQIADNSGQTPPNLVVTACVAGSRKIGFALADTPNAKSPAYPSYLTNIYGGTTGNIYYYYSSLWPPSLKAYPTLKVDAALQISAVDQSGTPVQADGTYYDRLGAQTGLIESAYTPASDDFTFPASFSPPQPCCGLPQIPASFYSGSGFRCPVGTDPWYQPTQPASAQFMYGCFDEAHKPYTAVAADGTVTCADLAKTSGVHLYWNDMGPDGEPWNELQSSDDHWAYTQTVPAMDPSNTVFYTSTDTRIWDNMNYRDVELTITCSPTSQQPYLQR